MILRILAAQPKILGAAIKVRDGSHTDKRRTKVRQYSVPLANRYASSRMDLVAYGGLSNSSMIDKIY